MVGARILFGCVLFLVLDFAFLYLNRQSFQHQIINVQRVAMIPKYGGVVMTYLLLLAGFYYFVLRQYRSVTEAAMLGGLVNGVYELTN